MEADELKQRLDQFLMDDEDLKAVWNATLDLSARLIAEATHLLSIEEFRRDVR